MRIRINDTHFAIHALGFMSWKRFNEIFYIEKSILQKFLALCLVEGIQLDIVPHDEKKSNKPNKPIWKWKGN